jgi:hypothetical protein
LVFGWLQEESMSDWQPDFDRLELDLSDQNAPTATSPSICIYVDTAGVLNNDGQSKLIASLKLAREWFTENNPEGAAFDYEILEQQKSR